MSRIQQLVSRLADFQPRTVEENLPQAGILVPVTRNSIEPEIILTKRSEDLSTHKGQVAFPGGKFDDEDITLETTALRECHEEVGIHPDQVELIAPLSQLVSLHGIVVSPFVGLVPEDVDLTPNLGELDSVFKVPLSFFEQAEPTRRDRITYKNLALQVPSYDFEYEGERYEIWGLTAIVIVELMNQAFDSGITIFDEYQRSRR